MTYHYSEYRSEIFEQTLLATLAYHRDEWEWDFTQKEQTILEDDFKVMEVLYQAFLPYKERLQSYYLMGQGESILTVCYFYLLNKGLDPKTIEELHGLVLEMSEEDLDACLRLMVLAGSDEPALDQLSFVELLEVATAKPEEKWYFLAYHRQLMTNIRETVALSRELVAIYQPYLERSRPERQKFVADTVIEELINGATILKGSQELLSRKTFEYYVVSPWLVRFMMFSGRKTFTTYQDFLIVSTKIDKVLLSHSNLDEDNFSSALKTLSDLTRYKVLVGLTKPYAKSKDIAEELGITSAAVSFHRQKLQNAQFLLANSDDKHVKYDVNKGLLQAIIEKVKEDFELE